MIENFTVSQRAATKLKRLRESRNLTHEWLSLNSGVSVGTISGIERGKQSPSLKTLEKLLKALDCTFTDFFVRC